MERSEKKMIQFREEKKEEKGDQQREGKKEPEKRRTDQKIHKPGEAKELTEYL